MGKVESFFKYLIAKDIWEDMRLYHKNIGEQNLRNKISGAANYAVNFKLRLMPIPLEFDALIRLFDGKYVGGTIELLFAEYIRFAEHSRNKIRTESNERAEELDEMAETSQRPNQGLGAIVDKIV